jgi:hypothetical protein
LIRLARYNREYKVIVTIHRGYGEFIERKLVAKSMTVSVSIIPEDRSIPQMMEEASKRGHLFGIVINSQNEVHQSLTLNILHGTPQGKFCRHLGITWQPNFLVL